MDRLHFAYGSKLDLSRYPDGTRPIGPAMLADVMLAFAQPDAQLGLVRRLGQAVSGVLFAHVPDAQGRQPCTALHPDGTCSAAATWGLLAHRRHDFAAPADDEMRAARVWREAHGLEVAMLDSAAEGAAPPPAVRGIFIYGTLLPGEVRGGVLPKLGLIAAPQAATVRGRLLDLGDYPGLVLDGSGTVHGEVAYPRNLAAALPPLDEIEDARPAGAPGGMYRRSLVPATLADGTVLRVWTYVLDAAHLLASPAIPGGSWRGR